MNNSTVISLLTIGIPFLVALGVFGVLRQRGRRALTSGCVSIVVGVIASFVIAAVVLVTTIN